MPKWLKIAIVGAVTAVAIDYYLRPTLTKTVGLR